LIVMTVWITRRPDAEVAAELQQSQGPLAGLRLAVKDNVDVAGLHTTAACPEFAYQPHRDAAAVAALRSAGAVVVGKTNLDQFATGSVGTRSPYGPVPDSRRPEYISGGSSAGSAVAVATGEADIAIGTDTAGSGRVPVGLQGIVGVKPTLGVISTDGVVPACESYDCVPPARRERRSSGSPCWRVPSRMPSHSISPRSQRETKRQWMFGRWPWRTPPNWWSSARTFRADRWFTSSPTWAPGGPARSRRRRVTGCRCWRLFPTKPAITRVPDGAAGAALLGHRWLLSPAALGKLLAALPAPMQLDKVEFDDGTWRTAFGCEGAAATGPDISEYGSWPAAAAAGAV
jgi:Amidase